MYLHSNFYSGLRRRILAATECVLAVQGRSGSSKVHNCGTNRKHICDFLLVLSVIVSMVLSCTVSEIRRLRYGDLLAKRAYFSYPSLIRRPCSLCFFGISHWS